jgi:hypothetical protein
MKRRRIQRPVRQANGLVAAGLDIIRHHAVPQRDPQQRRLRRRHRASIIETNRSNK